MNADLQQCLHSLREHPGDLEAVRRLGALLDSPDAPSGPEIRQSLDDIRSYQGDSGQWPLVIELINVELDRIDDQKRRIALLSQKARVLESEMLDARGAVNAFQQALQIFPDDREAQDALKQLELERDNWSGIVGKYVEEAEASRDLDLRANLLLAAAEVLWRHEADVGGDPEISKQIERHLGAALGARSDHAKAGRLLERLFWRQGRYRELAPLIEARAEHASTREERAVAHMDLGRLLAGYLENMDGAVEHYRKALVHAPGHPTPFRALVGYYTESADWPKLCRLYEDTLRHPAPVSARQDLWLQLGRLYQEKLGDSERAEAAFAEVRKADAAQPAMLDFYRGYFKERQDRGALRKLLERALRTELPADRRLALSCEAADLVEADGKRHERAIDLWRSVLRQTGRLRGGAGVAADSVARAHARAVQRLRSLYREIDPPRWSALCDLLRQEADRLPIDEAALRVELLCESAEIYRDQLQLDSMVINTYRAVLAIEPAHEGAAAALCDRYQELGRHHDLIEVLNQRIEHARDDAQRVALLHRVSDVWVATLGHSSQAIAPLQRILVVEPHDEAALSRLGRIYRERRDWERLRGLLVHEASFRDGQRRQELLREVAQLTSQHPGGKEEVVVAWGDLLRECPGDSEALGHLAQHYRRQKSWTELVDILEQVTGQQDTPLTALEELAELYAEQIGDEAKALACWKRVLERQPDHAKAFAVSKGLLVRSGDAEQLEQLILARAGYEEFAEALVAAAERAAQSETKARIYHKLAAVCADNLGNPERAAKAYERVLAATPDDEDAADRLAQFYEESGKWTRLVELLEARLARCAQLEQRTRLMARLAEVHEKNLKVPRDALNWRLRLFEAGVSDDEACEEIERLARSVNDWEPVAEAYRAAYGSADGADSHRLAGRLGHVLLQKLRRADEAEPYFRQLAFGKSAADTDAAADAAPVKDASVAGSSLEALEQIYRLLQRWPELVEVLERRAQLTDDVASRVELLFGAAFLWEERLGDVEAAVRCFEGVLEVNQENLRATRALERLYAVQGAWSDLDQLLRAELERVVDPEARAELLCRRAELLEERLGQPAEAVELYSEALASAHPPRSAVAALERYRNEAGVDRLSITQRLAEHYERASDWANLLTVTRSRLELESEASERLVTLRLLSSLARERLGDQELALQFGLELLRLDPADAGNRRQLLSTQDPESLRQVLAVMEQCCGGEPVSSDPALERVIRTQIVKCLDERLQKPTGAVPHLQRLLEIEPEDGTHYPTLTRILREGGRWRELQQALNEWLDLIEGDPVTAERLLREICTLSEDVLDDREAAIVAYQRLVELDPNDGEARRSLERHYRNADRWQDVHDLLERAIQQEDNPRAELDLWVRLAEVRINHLDDAVGGLELLEQAVDRDASAEGALRLLEQLLAGEGSLRERAAPILERAYAVGGDWPRLVEILLLERALYEDDSAAADRLCRAAKIQSERLERPQAAFNTLSEALLLCPDNTDIAGKLKELSALEQGWTQLAQSYEAGADAAREIGNPGAEAWLLYQCAEVYDKDLADPDQAVTFYERALSGELEATLVESARQALRTLYRGQSSWKRLADLLLASASAASDQELRRKYRLEAAQLCRDELGDTARAISVLEELVGEDSDCPAALGVLDELYGEAELWADQARVVEARVAFADEENEAPALLRRAADLRWHQLNELDAAIALYQRLRNAVGPERDVLEALSSLFEAAEQWSELAEVLHCRVAQGGAPAEVSGLLAQVGQVQLDRLHAPKDAMQSFDRALHEESSCQAAIEGLERLTFDENVADEASSLLAERHKRCTDWEAYVGVLSRLAERSEPARRMAISRDIASVCETELDDPRRAFTALATAVAVARESIDVRPLAADLRRLADSLDAWRAYVDELCPVAESCQDEGLKVELFLQLALACEEQLGDLSGAVANYRRVLDSRPQHEPSLRALERIYREAEDWGNLVEVLRQLASTLDHELSRELLIESAKIREQQLDDPQGAIVDYERIYSSSCPAEDFDELARLYAECRRWPELERVLLERAESESSEEVTELYSRLAQVRYECLVDHGLALDACQRALELGGRQPAIIEIAEALTADPELKVRAASALEPVYAAQQRWSKLVSLMAVRLDAAKTQESQLAIELKIARIYEEQIEDFDKAFDCYRSLFAKAPDRECRARLVRLAGLGERWSELARVFENALEARSELDAEGRELAVCLAGIYEDRLFEWRPAATWLRRVLSHDSTPQSISARYERLLTRYERWEELLEFYRDEAKRSSDSDRRRATIIKMCRVWEEALEDLPRAIEGYRSLLALDETDPTVVAALERLYRATSRWLELCQLLDQQLDLVVDDGRVAELRCRIAQVYEQKLEQPHTAISYYEAVLADDPCDQSATAALERLILHRDLRFKIAQVLAPAYRAQDAWAKLVVIYDAQLEFVTDEERVGLLREIARLHEERGGSLELALRALSRACLLAPHDGSLLAEAERLAGVIGDWAGIADLIRQLTTHVYDPALLRRLYSRRAEILEAELEDVEAAIVSWQQVLSLKDDDIEAIDALLRLLPAAERYSQFVEVLRRKARCVSEASQRLSCFEEMAVVYEEKLSDLAQAIENWRQALSIDGEHDAALVALSRLYERVGDWMELVWVLKQRVERAKEPVERRQLQMTLAQVYDERLGESVEAAEAYQLLLDWDRDDAEAEAALQGILERGGRWSELLDLVEKRAHRAADPGAAAAAWLAAGQLLLQQLDDPASAVDRLSRAVATDPECAEARNLLHGLIADAAHGDRCADVLESFYQDRGDDAGLVEVLQARAERAVDGTQRQQLLSRAAKLQEERLGDAEGAFEQYLAAFDADPSSAEARRQLERLAEELDRMDVVVEAYVRRLASVYEGQANYDLHLRVGQLAEEQLEDDKQAEQHYRAALASAEDETDVLQALERVLERMQDHAGLAEILLRRAENLTDPLAQGALFARLGELRLDKLDDAPQALTAFAEALSVDPSNRQALTAVRALVDRPTMREDALDLLEPVVERSGDYATLAELWHIRVETLRSSERRVRLLQRLADLYEQSLGQADAALEALLRALREDAGNETVFEDAESLARRLSATERLAEAGSAIVLADPDDVDRFGLALKCVGLFVEQLQQPEPAERLLECVLAVDPNNQQALVALESLRREASLRDDHEGGRAALAEAIERRARAVSGREKTKLLLEAASIREGLGQVETVVEELQQVLALEESCWEASDALERIYHGAERWPELVDFLCRRAKLADDDAVKRRLDHARAAILRDKLDDVDGAAKIYQSMIGAKQAVRETWEALGAILESRERWGELIEVLEQALDCAEDDAERLALRLRIGRISAEALDDHLGASDQYRRALPLVDDDSVERRMEIRDALIGSLTVLGQWDGVSDLLQEAIDEAERIQLTENAARYRVDRARLLYAKLCEVDAARAEVEGVLAAQPKHVGALLLLSAICEEQKETDRAAALLEQVDCDGMAAQEVSELKYRLGQIARSSGNDGKAAARYNEALDRIADHRDAIAGLREIAADDKAWQNLLQRLLARSDALIDDNQRADCLWEAGQIAVERLDDPERALSIWETAAKLVEPDRERAIGLSQAYLAVGKFDAAERVLRPLLSGSAGLPRREQATLHYRLGKIAEQRGESTTARLEYERAYRCDSTHGPAAAALGRLYTSLREWAEARRIYRAMLLQSVDSDFGISRADILLQLGQAHLALGEKEKARAMYERGLEIDGGHEQLMAALEKLAE